MQTKGIILKIILFIISFVLSVTISLKAQIEYEIIQSKAQNDEWIQKLKESDFQYQLLMIRNRILSDTNLYIEPNKCEEISSEYEIYLDSIKNVRHKVEGKPMWAFFYKDDYYIIRFTNLVKNIYAIEIANFLNEKRIKKIVFAESGNSESFFGSISYYGLIEISLKTKRNFKKVIKMIKEAHATTKPHKQYWQ